MRLLIVNADDYGLTRGVSRGILRSCLEGIVTSTSVLAVAPAFEEAALELAGHPRIGVGVHLAAVGEDPPLLPAARVPSLVDAHGRFPADWKAFLLRARRVRPDELEAELAAQIDRVRSAGLAVDHLDAHQHLHLFGAFRDVVLRLARRFTIPAIRVPRGGARRPAGLGVRWLAGGLRRAADAAGVRYPEMSEGFDASGRMTSARLLDAIARVARSGASSAEILLHPGEADDPGRRRYAWGYRWEEELAAALDPRARDAIRAAGLTPGTYRDLPGAGAP